MLKDGKIKFCNYSGYPILENGKPDIDDGQTVLEIPGPMGDKILYR